MPGSTFCNSRNRKPPVARAADGVKVIYTTGHDHLRRRYLVSVDNFYKWRKTAAGKQP